MLGRARFCWRGLSGRRLMGFGLDSRHYGSLSFDEGTRTCSRRNYTGIIIGRGGGSAMSGRARCCWSGLSGRRRRGFCLDGRRSGRLSFDGRKARRGPSLGGCRFGRGPGDKWSASWSWGSSFPSSC